MNAFMGGVLVGLARISVVVGMALILGKTVPRMRSKASRFIVLFVACLLIWFAYGYVKHLAFGYHESMMSSPVALIFALLWALLYPFWGPPSQNSKTR